MDHLEPEGGIDLDGSQDRVDDHHDQVNLEEVLVVSRELLAEGLDILVAGVPVDKVDVILYHRLLLA